MNRVNKAKVEEFIVSIINNFDPNFVTSPESSFYDLYVRFFNLTVISSILQILADFESKQDYDNTSMSELDYDKLTRRWFVDRNSGNKASALLTLVFDNPNNVFTIRTGDAYSINGKVFNPTSNQTILRIDYKKSTTVAGVEYSVEVPSLCVTAGYNLNVNIGDTVNLPYVNLTGLLRAYVSSDVIVGSDSESNDQLRERLKSKISVENLINLRSINSVLTEAYPGVISNLEVVGYLEPEMFRDLVSTQIPLRTARLLFANKTSLQLPRDKTLFYYNSISSIKYRPVEDFVITMTSDWNIAPNGFYFVDVPLELISIANPSGFLNDVPIEVLKNQGSISTPSFESLSLIDLNFMGCTSRTDYQKVPVIEPKREIITYGTQGFVSAQDLNKLAQLGKFETALPEDVIFINDIEYVITSVYAGGDAVVTSTAMPASGSCNWMLIRYTIEKSIQTQVHVGGVSDIYARVPVVRTVKSFKVPTNTKGIITIPSEYVPILKIHDVFTPANKQINFYEMVVTEPELRFSALDSTVILIDEGFIGTTVLIEFSYTPFISTIYNFVNSRLQRIIQENTLVKYFNPVFISLIANVEVEGTTSDADGILRSAVLSYLVSLSSNNTLPISKIIEALHNALPSLKRVSSITVYAQQYLPDGSIITLSSDNLITPEIHLSSGVSARTTQFLMDSAEFIFI